MNATSPEALYSLLAAALDEGKTELAVRMGYWGENGGTRVEEAMQQLREERELTETIPWVVNYYPGERDPGLVEFLLDPPEPEEGWPPAENGEEGEEGEGPSEADGEESPGEDGAPGGAPEEGAPPQEDKEPEGDGQPEKDPAAPAEPGESGD